MIEDKLTELPNELYQQFVILTDHLYDNMEKGNISYQWADKKRENIYNAMFSYQMQEYDMRPLKLMYNKLAVVVDNYKCDKSMGKNR